MVIADTDMVVQQFSPGHTLCLIICLMSVWNSPLCDISACPLLTLAAAVIILY